MWATADLAHETADCRIDGEIACGFPAVLGTPDVWRPCLGTTHAGALEAIYRAGTEWKITDQADVAL